MKFAIIAKPRVFMDWNNEGSLELGMLPANEISIKAVTEFSCGMLSFAVEDATRFAEGCTALAQKKTQASITVTGEGGCFIQAQYTNSGDPYREGVRVTIGVEEQWNDQIAIDLESHRAVWFADAIAEQASSVDVAHSPEQPVVDLTAENAVLRDKAKCWDWFVAQYWCLNAVETWGSLDFDFPADLEAYILKQDF